MDINVLTYLGTIIDIFVWQYNTNKEEVFRLKIQEE